MRRPISTRAHGIIDYTCAAAAEAVPQRLPNAPRTAALLRTAGAAATGQSLLTNYELGAVRMLPMKGHLGMDVAIAAALIALPWFLPAHERRYAVVPSSSA